MNRQDNVVSIARPSAGRRRDDADNGGAAARGREAPPRETQEPRRSRAPRAHRAQPQSCESRESRESCPDRKVIALAPAAFDAPLVVLPVNRNGARRRPQAATRTDDRSTPPDAA